MPTPPTPNETLLATHAAYIANDKNQSRTASALGVSRETVQRRVRQAAERGLAGTEPVLEGYAIKSISSKLADGAWIKQVKEHGEDYAVPEGHSVKGESALVDAEGRVIQKWVKTRNEYSAADVAEILQAAFKDYTSPLSPIDAPSVSDADLLTLVPCNDWHINLLTWARETGINWDLDIAEVVIGRGIEDAIDRSPPSGIGIVLGGGDLLHADTNEARTSRSNNVLDTDGRHQKGLEVAGRLMVRTIDAALRKNGRVIVRILQGNHDEQTSVAIGYFLLAWYRSEPRVFVDVDASLFFWHRFGKVMLGATHGHTVKLKDMASIMAHRRAEDWGATKFRYVHGFHIHHQSKYATEGGGVIMESHQAPIPQDAWHFGAGFLSGRSVQTITYHRDFGEVSRVRVAILDAANDNEPSEVRNVA
ncbi:helix-turn-helix domain-containing protein [Mesorhizobium sp. BR1-1-13]|uniref:helix-turn-helix domain-containing protein n=1 Tax=Mesorhizobium sp. BR1-1-13 TaxID=2876656 RepID=UPI001CD14C82|nr:helix-turn-helix domain-containing protein [Mesorhizobium sp. BR1-1-13]MBZ9943412.1 helix-turn-helix domain-containing protein [Mesorhizobium sp. BR1-1-13]